MAVSIVISHYGDVALTWKCAEAIAESTPEEYELVVVDNGTGVDLPGRVLRNVTNLGFAVACNQGARSAQHELVLFLNNDTEPQSGWLSPLIEVMQDPHMAAAASASILSTGELQESLPRVIIDEWGQLDTRNRAPVGVPAGTVPLLAACVHCWCDKRLSRKSATLVTPTRIRDLSGYQGSAFGLPAWRRLFTHRQPPSWAWCGNINCG